MTPQRHIILAALIRKAAKLEADLEVLDGKKPSALQFVLVSAREDAIKACEALIYADPTNIPVLMSLQMEVRLFIELVEASQAILEAAADAERTITEEEQEIVQELVMQPHAVEGEE